MEFLRKLGRRAALQALPTFLVVMLVLAAVGRELYLRDRASATSPLVLLREREKVASNLGEIQRRIDRLAAQIPPEQQRAARADKVVSELRGMTGVWDWLTGNRDQLASNRDQLARMEALRDTAAARVTGLKRELNQARWQRDRGETDLRSLDAEIRAETAGASPVPYYLRQAWLRARRWLITGFVLSLLIPVLWPPTAEKWREAQEA